MCLPCHGKEDRKRVRKWKDLPLESGNIKQIIIYEGYPSKTDTDKILIFPWSGYILTSVLHKEFGPEPIFAYAIKLEGGSGL